MRCTPEPKWLERLIDGSLTADLPTAADARVDEHHGALAIAELACIAALAGRAPSAQVSLVDPTVGRGVMLATLGRSLRLIGSRVDALGIDIDQDTVDSARLTAASGADILNVAAANVLIADVLVPGSAELIVYEPPWGAGWRSEESLIRNRESEGWYPHGTGRFSDSGWLFLQRALSTLRPEGSGGGRLVTFMNDYLLRDQSGRLTRRAIIDNDVLEAVIRLPSGMAENTAIPLHLVVLRTDKPKWLQGCGHVIDLRPYMTTRDRGKRRRISPEGLRVLWSALEKRRTGPNNRVVDISSFARQAVRVTSKTGRRDTSWRTEVSHAQPDEDVRRRYGPVPMECEPDGEEFISFDVAHYFGRGPGARQGEGSELTRLSALLAAPPQVHDPANDDDGSTGSVVYVPTGQGKTVTTPPSIAGRVLRLQTSSDLVHAEYLAGWLNSEAGSAALARGLDRGASGSSGRAVGSDPASLWQLTDEIVVPLRALEAQQEFADALLSLRRVENLVEEARLELWSDGQQVELLIGPFEPLLDQSLDRWSASLPYPFATALWTLMSRNTVEARHRQIFHTWESYAAFLATVLLSVLRQDADLCDVEGPELRRVLDDAGLSMERPTFGTWNVVVQRLSSRFRSLLDGKPDDQARISQMFGGASPAVLRAILQPACVQLLTDVSTKRNAWLGHAGATSEATLQAQIDHLTNALEQLRSLLRGAWTRAPLVRAGHAVRKRGIVTQDVELVMGTNVPFRPAKLTVGEMMDAGELYIATDGCVRPVPLSHLVVLRPSPGNERHACYFFNRVDADKVRLVSYQMTDSGEIEEPRSEFVDELSWLWPS